MTGENEMCISCGEKEAKWGTATAKHCFECNRLIGHLPDMSDAWPLEFAHSMKKLARLSRVGKLLGEIESHLQCDPRCACQQRETACDCGLNDALVALKALADMAKQVP